MFHHTNITGSSVVLVVIFFYEPPAILLFAVILFAPGSYRQPVDTDKYLARWQFAAHSSGGKIIVK